MKTVAIIQARMGSTRLPGKIAKPILGKPMLVHVIERAKRAQYVDEVVLATSDLLNDDATALLGEASGVRVFRGSEKDVLDRFYKAATEVGADVVMRLTGDCPLMDPAVIDEVFKRFVQSSGIDYTSTPSDYPEGLDTEAFHYASLEHAARNAILPSEREHVTVYLKNHPELFVIDRWKRGKRDDSTMHWSVDSQYDLDFVTKVYESLYPQRPDFGMSDVLELLREHPEYMEINKGGTGWEGLEKSLKEDEVYKAEHGLL